MESAKQNQSKIERKFILKKLFRYNLHPTIEHEIDYT